MFDLGPRATGAILSDVAKACDKFPLAEDRSVLLVRLFLRRGENEEAAIIIAKASELTRSYFWQLQFAHLAIRAYRKELARVILGRCQALAEQCKLEAFPFAPPLETPTLPILALLPEHALRAVAAISESMTGLPENGYGPLAWYSRDPRLFHPHQYLIRTEGRAVFYRTGSLYVAIPTGRPFIAEDIVSGKLQNVCFGETLAELEFECKLRGQTTVTAIATDAVDLEQEQRLIRSALQRLKSLEAALEERTNRLAALEFTMDERSRRLATLEAARPRTHRVGSLLRRWTLSRQG